MNKQELNLGHDCLGEMVELYVAVFFRNASLQEIKAILANGAKINAKDTDGSTILHELCLYNRPMENILEKIKFFIDAGADINAQDQDGRTPLMRATASFFKGAEKMKILLSAGVDVNIVDKNGATALCYAIDFDEKPYDKIKLLLDAGADLEILDNEGYGALATASFSAKSQELIKTLLNLHEGMTNEDIDKALSVISKSISSLAINLDEQRLKARLKKNRQHQARKKIRRGKPTRYVQ